MDLREMIDDSEKIVFFGGAGVSAESGVPDFHFLGGWQYYLKYRFTPEYIFSEEYFFTDTEAFYEFYRDRVLALLAQPNATHRKLAEWEKAGRDITVITQNVDGLHQKAGSKNVLELYGSIYRNYCLKCGRSYPVEKIYHGKGVPHCPCGGIIKPDVVLYGEPLVDGTLDRAIQAISKADMLIVAGTSFSAKPAADLPYYFHGKHSAIINHMRTNFDKKCDLILYQNIAEVFKRL